MRRLIGLGLAVATLAACGSGGTNTVQLISSAGTKTAAARTARIAEDIRTTPGATASAGIPIAVHSDGVMDFAARKGDISSTVAGAKVEVLIVGTVLYEHLPQLSSVLGGKAWLKLDLDSLGKLIGVGGIAALAQSGPSDPSQFLSYFKGVSGPVTKVGTAVIRGVKTTEYHLVVDLNKAAAGAGTPASKTALQQLVKTLGVTTFPIDVWVDAQGRIRRQHQAFDYSHASLGTIPTTSLPKGVDITLEYYDFGVPVTVTLPPADQVTDASALISGQTGSG